MCGKFTQLYSWQNIVAFSRFLDGVRMQGDHPVVCTPMRFASIVRLNSSGEREMAQMRWGFARKDHINPSRPKHMHARAETLETLRTFAEAFAQRRGILMVQTFNEGEELPNGKTKQWTIAPSDQQPIAIAVIGETWTNGSETLETFVMVTTPANPLIGKITDRMPAILPRETWPVWLGEVDADAKAVLQTYEDSGAWSMLPQTDGRQAPRLRPQGRLL